MDGLDQTNKEEYLRDLCARQSNELFIKDHKIDRLKKDITLLKQEIELLNERTGR